MGSPYREGEPGLGARARELEGVVRQLEGRLSDFFWQEVAAGLGLGGPAGVVTDRGEPPSARVDRLEERVRSIEEVLHRLPELEARWLVPSDAPPRPLWWPEWAPPGAGRASASRQQSWYEAVVEEGGSSEPSIALPEGGVGGRPVARGLPLCVTVTGGREEGASVFDQDGEPPTLRLRTTVASAAGPIKIAPWSRGGAWLTRPLLRDAVSTGDRAFDRALCAQGEGATARALLSERIRGALLILHTDGTAVELSVARGEASLSWCPNSQRPSDYRHSIRSALEVMGAARSLKGRALVRS